MTSRIYVKVSDLLKAGCMLSLPMLTVTPTLRVKFKSSALPELLFDFDMDNDKLTASSLITEATDCPNNYIACLEASDVAYKVLSADPFNRADFNSSKEFH